MTFGTGRISSDCTGFRRKVRLNSPYLISRLEQANIDYAKIEHRSKAGEAVEAVLVSAGPIDALRKAYPNYFLDTQGFVERIEEIVKRAGGP
jgi:putative GTP pyrophosphokinase